MARELIGHFAGNPWAMPRPDSRRIQMRDAQCSHCNASTQKGNNMAATFESVSLESVPHAGLRSLHGAAHLAELATVPAARGPLLLLRRVVLAFGLIAPFALVSAAELFSSSPAARAQSVVLGLEGSVTVLVLATAICAFYLQGLRAGLSGRA
jgi:Tfp pilus assembly protein FimV